MTFRIASAFQARSKSGGPFLTVRTPATHVLVSRRQSTRLFVFTRPLAALTLSACVGGGGTTLPIPVTPPAPPTLPTIPTTPTTPTTPIAPITSLDLASGTVTSNTGKSYTCGTEANNQFVAQCNGGFTLSADGRTLTFKDFKTGQTTNGSVSPVLLNGTLVSSVCKSSS